MRLSSAVALLSALLFVGTALCVAAQGPVPEYVVSSVSPAGAGSPPGWVAMLTLSNPGAGTYGRAIKQLQLSASFETESRVHFTLTDPTTMRFSVPTSVLPYPARGSRDFPIPGTAGSYDPANPSYVVPMPAVGQNIVGNVNVIRTSDKVQLFSMGELEYSNQFLQLTTLLPQESDTPASQQPNLYGLGERVLEWQLPTDPAHKLTMFAVDNLTPYDTNTYGSHPFLLQVLNSGAAHGLFVRSSNGMDVVLSQRAAQFRLIGGVLEWYLFMGPTPEQVTQQYHGLIGRPALPPFWSLGFHQCKWGYKNIGELQQVVEAYAANQIPLDTITSDIDHMDNKLDFTFDPVNYPLPQVQQFVSDLHAKGQRYVVIVDPGIHNLTGYAPYDEGLESNVFVKQADGVTPFIGKVWPGTTAFPDWLHSNTSAYWTQLIGRFLAEVPVDGLWIDMNEAANFGNGPAGNPSNPVNNPPYAINNMGHKKPLNTKTLPMDAKHGWGIKTYLEYDVHNLYGMGEAIVTRQALEQHKGTRSFVLSRSTFVGTGAHAAHWLGDNEATWDDMRLSISGVLSMNLFGIPMVGADICGFSGNTTEELCVRWQALGAFYPFARNHHNSDSPGTNDGQEPYRWPRVMTVTKRTLAKRYELLPVLYTLMWNAHINGGTVARSLVGNYPSDAEVRSIGNQFMWGSSLLITPVLEEGADSVKGYFSPTVPHYDAWTLQALNSNGGWMELPCPLEQGVLVHYVGGSILPTQPSTALTTAASRQAPFNLVVALDFRGAAKGNLFFDGRGDDLVPELNSVQITFAAQVANGNGIQWDVQSNTLWDPSTLPLMQTITVVGLWYGPNSITLDGAPLPSSSFSYDSDKEVLVLKNLDVDLNKSGAIVWNFPQGG